MASLVPSLNSCSSSRNSFFLIVNQIYPESGDNDSRSDKTGNLFHLDTRGYFSHFHVSIKVTI